MEPQLALFVETRITLPRSMKDNAPIVKKNILLDNALPLKLLATCVKEVIILLTNVLSTPWWNKGNKKDPNLPKEKDHLYPQTRQSTSKDQRNPRNQDKTCTLCNAVNVRKWDTTPVSAQRTRRIKRLIKCGATTAKNQATM